MMMSKIDKSEPGIKMENACLAAFSLEADIHEISHTLTEAAVTLAPWFRRAQDYK